MTITCVPLIKRRLFQNHFGHLIGYYKYVYSDLMLNEGTYTTFEYIVIKNKFIEMIRDLFIKKWLRNTILWEDIKKKKINNA